MENPNTTQMAKAIQFMHPQKMLSFAHGLDEATIAALFGLDVETYRETKSGFDVRAREAAQELLADPSFTDRVDGLPFQPGAIVVGIGESVTADVQGWLEMLRHLLELRRPQDGVRVINEGVSDLTSSMALRRFTAILAHRPDWIICAVGAADALRVGREPAKTLVSPKETARNLEAMRRTSAQTGTKWVWVTPPPVDEGRIASNPFFRRLQLSLRNDDLVSIGDIVRRQPDPVVDVQVVLGSPPAPELQLPDGMHPSLAGQKAIARALVERLTS